MAGFQPLQEETEPIPPREYLNPCRITACPLMSVIPFIFLTRGVPKFDSVRSQGILFFTPLQFFAGNTTISAGSSW